VEFSNTLAAEECGYNSIEDHRGKSAIDSFSKESAYKIIAGHQQAMHTSCLQIHEEDVFLTNGSVHQYLTFLWPKYNLANSIDGVLGCSIRIGKHPLANILSKLTSLNILKESNNSEHKKKNLSSAIANMGVFFSKRERECINLIMQGRSAKHIGLQLHLSFRTVENYISNIKAKFYVSSKQELIDKIIFLME
jgi:DNA-binding CsgD family transcriptional regulator